MFILYQLKESLVFAYSSLVLNKLRTFLSLLGITIGIFTIITVFTVIDSLENNIRESISKLGDNVVYLQKWPWSTGSSYPWWKYMKRPVPKLEESKQIMERSSLTKALSFMITSSKNIHYKENSANSVNIVAVEHSYEDIRSFEIYNGRYFSQLESYTGKNRAIVGYNIANKLFDNDNPVGKHVKLMGKKLLVIGVFQKEGEDMFGMNTDDQVIIPINYAKTIFDIRSEYLNPNIMIKAKEGISSDELIEELTGIMRSIRRIKPIDDDNFALNQSSLISQGLDSIFSVIDIVGAIIGGFSILVGGFGIANIMFVSVKEQTKLIGIQKALGAKSYFVLLQFLYESVILALLGGIIGLILIFFLTFVVSNVTEMTISMSIWNVSLGLIISVVIGIIAGIVPAYNAAKLNPVEAISTGL